MEAEDDENQNEAEVTEVVKVEPKVVTMEDLEEEEEDDRKKRKKKKGKKEEEEAKEGENEEEEEGGTMKSAAQKRKEKKEREKQKKMVCFFEPQIRRLFEPLSNFKKCQKMKKLTLQTV